MNSEELYKHLAKKDGISDRVITAMKLAPREEFVPEHLKSRAYENHPLPIGYGQTISQPSMVGIMLDLLKLTGNEKVLEVGTGSGWVAAILSNLAREVYTIERIPELGKTAEERLRKLGFDNVKVIIGDGTVGYEEEAPYDAIIVSAGAPAVPQPFISQLKPSGRMVIPVGSTTSFQKLMIVEKNEKGEVETRSAIPCSFVPLIGENGWKINI